MPVTLLPMKLAGWFLLLLDNKKYSSKVLARIESIRFPLASIDESPITRPHIFIAYAKKASSDDDSSSLPSHNSKRPAANE